MVANSEMLAKRSLDGVLNHEVAPLTLQRQGGK
jgi:hypothetical protein